LKPPGTKRLKLQSDALRSHLRRYMKVKKVEEEEYCLIPMVGQCGLTLSNPR
jgi:hypothetical protein